MNKQQKLRNGSVNKSFKKHDLVLFNGQEYRFLAYFDYGFTCKIKNIKTGDVEHIFAYEDDIKLKHTNLWRRMVSRLFVC